MRRWWLVLGHLAATLAAPAAHRHGPSSHGVPQAQSGCDDPGAHWAAHTGAPDLSHPDDPCPACQLRAESPLAFEAGPILRIAEASSAPMPEPTPAPRIGRGSITLRGPPIA